MPKRSRTRIRRASRTFSSSLRAVASSETSSVFTSTTRAARVGGCTARMSIDPRSPNSEYVTSPATTHPRRRRRAATRPTRAACRSSRSRSSSPPRHETSTTTRASTAANTLAIVRSAIASQCPRSMSDTPVWLMPARAAISLWRNPRRRRSARSTRPIRTPSTHEIFGRPAHRRITWRGVGQFTAVIVTSVPRTTTRSVCPPTLTTAE